MKKKIIVTILLMLLAYIIGCFVGASFNINNWEYDLRCGIAGTCSGILFLYYMITFMDNTKI